MYELTKSITRTCVPRSFILARASSLRLPCSTPDVTRGIGMSLCECVCVCVCACLCVCVCACICMPCIYTCI